MSPKFLAVAAVCATVTMGAQAADADGKRALYIVQLGDAPAAMYGGGIAGLPATRPTAGTRFNARARDTQAYVAYLERQRSAVISRAAGINIRTRYSHAFNGFSASLTQDEARMLMGVANVVSVRPVTLERPVTVSTPDFLGLTGGGLWSRLDAVSRQVKGDDVIVGVIDTGVWPEDPAFSDRVDSQGRPVAYHQPGTVAYGPPPGRWRGTCQTGPGFTAQMCNNKLIGARFYPDYFQYYGIPFAAASEYVSPRDGDGHGSHTASTAAGNGPVDTVVNGQSLGDRSGIAPRARIAAYKACFTSDDPLYTGCPTDSLVAAIEDAVADGVDVINFSISGSRSDVPDAVELAFLGAASAGVFVATAAGNSGPDASSLNHPWPWTTTVAASTHDRSYLADLALGNGASFTGAAYPSATGLRSAPLIAAINAGVLPYDALSAADKAALAQCFTPADRATIAATANSALDPTKTAGKVVVCQRGGNPLVNKGSAVTTAGGAGLVILNTPSSADTTFVLPQPLPAVHLKAEAYATLWPYASGQGKVTPTAAISPTRSVRGLAPAPVMASFSGAGPNWAAFDTLKPDITAPGVGVLAAFLPPLTAQQHDQIALGNLLPSSASQFLDGTSMATPHVAGAAALLRQLHPGWSPAAVKSALMTATSGVLLDTGAADPNRFRYGSGHLAPTPAADSPLVYDLTDRDYVKFLCGIGQAAPPPYESCSSSGSTRPANLNLPSLTLSVGGTGSITRTVTNVSSTTKTFVAAASLPGWTVAVQPASMTLAPGQKASFTVTVTATGGAGSDWAYGDLTWSTNGLQKVRSPLTVRNLSVQAPAQINDTRPQNVRMFTVSSSTRPFPNARGLIRPSVRTGSLAPGERQCFDFTTFATATALRAQLRNDETAGGATTDLALSVVRNGTTVASSQGPGSDEVITMFRPATSAVHSVCVTNVSSGTLPTASFKLNFWQIAPGAAPQNMFAYYAPGYVSEQPTTIGLSWSVAATPPGHYLGMVEFTDYSGIILGATMVAVEVP